MKQKTIPMEAGKFSKMKLIKIYEVSNEIPCCEILQSGTHALKLC